MKKVLIYSIHPKYIKKIASGQKTIEVRKRTLPKWALKIIQDGGAVEAYGYETFGKSFYVSDETWGDKYPEWYGYEVFNERGLRLISEGKGQIEVMFKVTKIVKYVDYSNCTNNENGYECQNEYMYQLCELTNELKKTCLECEEIEKYGNGAEIYAHHLSNITSINPMDIDDFYKVLSEKEKSMRWELDLPECQRLRKAPQSFMSAYVKEEVNNG
jgi:hypothetical protein